MADAITIKALQDASLDAKSLEEVVNGDEAKQVTTRKGESYPSVKKAIKTMFENGGLPATPFKTKALMTGSVLIDGKYAMVTDDTVNNGLYVKTAGAWVKSEYDPLSSSKLYVDEKVYQDENANLIELRDKDGDIYITVDNMGEVYIPSVKGSVQNALKNVVTDVDTDENILNLFDSADNTVASIDNLGTLNIANILTSSGDVNSAIDKINNIDTDELNGTVFNLTKSVEGIRVAEQDATKAVHILADATETEGYRSLWAPSIIRMTKTRFYMSFDARSTGLDHDPIKVVGRIIDYDPITKTFIKGTIKDLAVEGIGSDGIPYSFLNPNVTYVEFGENAGRILVHFNRMTNPPDISGSSTARDYAPYYVYSDDGGNTFSAPIDMTPLFPWAEFGSNGILLFGPGHGIQVRTGKYKGRLILPAYTRHPTDLNGVGKWFASRVIYSDDGGDTYQWGESISTPEGLNEWQSAEASNGDIIGIFRLGSGRNFRYIGRSKDGGITFDNIRVIDEIKGAGVKTGFVNCANPFDYSLPKLVAIAPSDANETSGGRIDAHVWLSYDEGETWTYKKQIDTGVAQYSDATHIEPDCVLTIHGGGVHFRGNQLIGNLINLNFLLGK